MANPGPLGKNDESSEEMFNQLSFDNNLFAATLYSCALDNPPDGEALIEKFVDHDEFLLFDCRTVNWDSPLAHGNFKDRMLLDWLVYHVLAGKNWALVIVHSATFEEYWPKLTFTAPLQAELVATPSTLDLLKIQAFKNVPWTQDALLRLVKTTLTQGQILHFSKAEYTAMTHWLVQCAIRKDNTAQQILRLVAKNMPLVQVNWNIVENNQSLLAQIIQIACDEQGDNERGWANELLTQLLVQVPCKELNWQLKAYDLLQGKNVSTQELLFEPYQSQVKFLQDLTEINQCANKTTQEFARRVHDLEVLGRQILRDYPGAASDLVELYLSLDNFKQASIWVAHTGEHFAAEKSRYLSQISHLQEMSNAKLVALEHQLIQKRDRVSELERELAFTQALNVMLTGDKVDLLAKLETANYKPPITPAQVPITPAPALVFSSSEAPPKKRYKKSMEEGLKARATL